MQSWFPHELLARARQQPREAFVRAYKSPLSLVVILDAPASELAQGLKPETGPERDGLPFRTAALINRDPRDSLRPRHLTLVPEPGDRNVQVAEKLRQMASMCCHIIPISKRVESAFLASISIGRARNHDIVLRHASVSKFHANLEIEGEQLYVKDAGSRNHTFLNHERVLTRLKVEAGDNLRFGWVEALVATDEALWRAIRGL
jgi:hypothetical protein